MLRYGRTIQIVDDNDVVHSCRSHYVVRDQRYKLIYRYKDDLGIEGARPGSEDERKWEYI